MTSRILDTSKGGNRHSSLSSGNESNIKVYVRCRSRNQREIKENSGVVISTRGARGKEVIVQSSHNSSLSKTYTFDRVFGAESDQEEVFDGIAKNVLNEVLSGYNCTIFAYGQTGTGKTYTMSGDISSNSATSRTFLGENAGIIPRTLNDLFRHLEKIDDYSVKVSFIELYNEELKDLLSTNPPSATEKSLKIFDDNSANSSQKKSVMIQNMEEVYIKSPIEGLKLLQAGSYKRQVASTKCNDLSSRSHTVFTITVHIKYMENDEEFVKVGKLNLVDLAGSENIDRSGATNIRAKEAGMINQSLLTLGRVINSLVENSSHIPYRESKLTRLLQDSLGGQTKTCIIATISPAKISVDETLSTLEYAHRAKSIKNKPRVNQSLNKKQLITDCIEEIERLKRDLNATRNKNGVYLTTENYNLLIEESESRRIRIDELQQMSSGQAEKLKKIKDRYEDLERQNSEHEIVIEKLNNKISNTEERLEEVKNKLSETNYELMVNKAIVEQQEVTESKLEKLVNTYQDKLQLSISQTSKLSNILNSKDYKVDEQRKLIDMTFADFVSKIEVDQVGGLDKLSKEFQAYANKALNSLFGDFSELQKNKLDSLSGSISSKLSSTMTGLANFNNLMIKDSKSFNESFETSTTQFVNELKQINDSNLKNLIVANNTERQEVINKLNEISTEIAGFSKSQKSNILLMKALMETKVSGIAEELTNILKDGFKIIESRELQTKVVREVLNKEFEKMATERNRKNKELFNNINSLLSKFNTEQEFEYSNITGLVNREVETYDQQCLGSEKQWMNLFEKYINDGLTTKSDSDLQNQYVSIQDSISQDSNKMKSQMANFQKALESSRDSEMNNMNLLLSKLNANVEKLNQFSDKFSTKMSADTKIRSEEVQNVVNELAGHISMNDSEIGQLSGFLSRELEANVNKANNNTNEKLKEVLLRSQSALDSFKTQVLSPGQEALIESSNSIRGNYNTNLQDHSLQNVVIPKTDKLSILQKFNRLKEQQQSKQREGKRRQGNDNENSYERSENDDKENRNTQITPVPDKPMVMLDESNGRARKKLKFGTGATTVYGKGNTNGNNLGNILRPVNR